MADILLFGGELLIAASIAFLALSIHRDRKLRATRDSEQAESQRRMLDRSLRVAMLARRLPVQERIDALWLCWARGGRPGEEMVQSSLAALEEAKLVFPADLAADIDEASRLLTDYLRHKQWQSQAIDCGRHSERVALMERETELEKALLPKVAGLKALLAEASRVEGEG